PATTPNQIHSFSFPVLMMRITRYAQVIQNSGSNAFIVKMLSNPRMPGAVSVVIAASTCAKPLPPSSPPTPPVSTIPPPPPKLRRPRQRRQKSNREQRLTQRISHRPRDHRDQRRLIDIAPSEMTAAGQEVQLVTQVPIPVSRVQMHHQLARGNQEYNRGRA